MEVKKALHNFSLELDNLKARMEHLRDKELERGEVSRKVSVAITNLETANLWIENALKHYR